MKSNIYSPKHAPHFSDRLSPLESDLAFLTCFTTRDYASIALNVEADKANGALEMVSKKMRKYPSVDPYEPHRHSARLKLVVTMLSDNSIPLSTYSKYMRRFLDPLKNPPPLVPSQFFILWGYTKGYSDEAIADLKCVEAKTIHKFAEDLRNSWNARTNTEVLGRAATLGYLERFNGGIRIKPEIRMTYHGREYVANEAIELGLLPSIISPAS